MSRLVLNIKPSPRSVVFGYKIKIMKKIQAQDGFSVWGVYSQINYTKNIYKKYKKYIQIYKIIFKRMSRPTCNTNSDV